MRMGVFFNLNLEEHSLSKGRIFVQAEYQNHFGEYSDGSIMVWWLYLFRKKSPEWLCLLSMSNDFFRDKKLKGLLVSKVKVGK